jgi:hypothetical protein
MLIVLLFFMLGHDRNPVVANWAFAEGIPSARGCVRERIFAFWAPKRKRAFAFFSELAAEKPRKSLHSFKTPNCAYTFLSCIKIN